MSATREVRYDVDGLTMTAHLAQPAGEGPWPTVLIGHDGIGLDDAQRAYADQLAERGYLTLAMDYHGGATFFGRPDEMLARVLPLIADQDRMRTIGLAALDLLLAEAGADEERLAAVGFGAGGSIVLELARSGAPFRALSAVHPAPPTARAEDWVGVEAAVLLSAGSEDPLCTPEQLFTFAHALQDAGVDWQVHIYGGAEHAFWAVPTHPSGTATVPGVGYHEAHGARWWRATVDLLDETIGTGPSA